MAISRLLPRLIEVIRAYEQRAHSIMKQLLSDSDPNTRANALLSLRHFNDPSWREVAKQFLTDPAVSPRKMGTALLQKG